MSECKGGGGPFTSAEYFEINARGTFLDFQPRYDIFRMIDDALAFERSESIGVLPT